MRVFFWVFSVLVILGAILFAIGIATDRETLAVGAFMFLLVMGGFVFLLSRASSASKEFYEAEMASVGKDAPVGFFWVLGVLVILGAILFTIGIATDRGALSVVAFILLLIMGGVVFLLSRASSASRSS